MLAALVVTALAVNDAQALPDAYYTSVSKLSSGKWVKVKVTETGMQQLTFDQLRELGFSQPENVAVYGYSGVDLRNYDFSTSLPDDLPAVPVAVYGDKLVFYGVATEAPVEYLTSSGNFDSYSPQLQRNLQNGCAYYFLTDSYPQLAVAESDAEVVSSFDAVEDAQGLVWKNFTDRQPGDIGAYLFGENITSSKTYSIDMPGYNADSSTIPTFVYGVACKAATAKVVFSMPGASTVAVDLPYYGNDPGHLAYRYQSGVVSFPSLSKTATDAYQLTVDFSTSSTLSEGSMDYYLFSYPRTTDVSVAPQQMLAFSNLSSGQPVKLTYNGKESQLKVWEVMTSSTPRELKVKAIDEDGAYGFVADRNVYMSDVATGLQTIVFDPQQDLKQVSVVGVVENQNYHGLAVPDMLIVASPNCYQQALRLAQIHREKTGYDVAVVPFHEICNEFSSGLPHFMGIRRMVKMLYDRDPSKLKAVLLFGRAFHDNTGLTSAEDPEVFRDTYLPMFQCENTTGCGETPTAYATDALYGMLSDDFVFDYKLSENHFLRAPLDIQVGRIPASSDGEAGDFVSKEERYLDNPSDSPIYNRAFMLSDQGDSNLHLDQGQKIRTLLKTLSPSTMVDMLALPLYSKNIENMRDRIRQQLNRGVGLWMFLGHSSSGSYIGSGVPWSIAYDKDFAYDNPTFTLFGTCQSLKMDDQTYTLQDEMLLNPSGGMMAGIGASRPAYAQYNLYLVNMMARSFYSLTGNTTMGEVYRGGRNLFALTPNVILSGIGTHEGVATNNMAYNFAGDPLLPLRMPSGTVKVTNIDDDEVESDSSFSFDALESAMVEGNVYDADGNVDTSFNGQMTMLIYDGKHTEDTSSTADSSNPTVNVEIEDLMLQEVVFNVVNGHFAKQVTFAVPTYSGDHRINLFAINNERNRSAVGYLNGVQIGLNPSVDTSNVSAPVITSMYAVDEDYIEGDYVPGNFTVYAKVEPGELDLISTSDRIGGSVSLILDNSKKLTSADAYFKVNPDDGSATLAYPVTELSDGSHTLTLRVANVAGVSAERSLNVTVVNVSEATTVATEFARDEAKIYLKHSLSDAPEGRLVITDATGKTVFSADVNTFPYTWNLTNANGENVKDGIYSASVYFKAGHRYGYSTPATIVVGR